MSIGIENNVNREGSNYRDFELDIPDSNFCRQECMHEE